MNTNQYDKCPRCKGGKLKIHPTCWRCTQEIRVNEQGWHWCTKCKTTAAGPNFDTCFNCSNK